MLFSIYSQTESVQDPRVFFGEPLGSNDNPTWAIFGNAELATPKAEFSSEDRVYVNMEGGTATAAHPGVTGEGALVQWKCERRDAELSRAEAKEGASAGELDVKAPSAFDAENSDPAANTMTALAFDAEML